MRSPIIIAHRGASGYRPEHTLESYTLAIELGADFIEPDLVISRDGHLIARHENNITETTDVAERAEFATRKTSKIIEGKTVTGWFSEDFTLAELKTLRAKERLPFRNQTYNGQFQIPTFREILQLAQHKTQETGREIGIYPETKHPSYFQSIGLPLEEPLVEILKEFGYTSPDSPLFIQSFEIANLKKLNRLIDVPLVQLLGEENQQPYDFVLQGDKRTYQDLTTPAALSQIATYADAIGPSKRLIIPQAQDSQLLPPTPLIQEAHRVGLKVHAWTFRNEACFLAPEYQNQPEREYQQFFQLGVDGVFSDFPDVAFKVRQS
ncbi:glycerophosphodiester phosphodiesterase [Desertifilum sp. FACHB-1129]|uniref:glycerophosphodiester phosphodiesterase n=2 Tax=Desertifilum tharense IPPAS B-1220 TaxID=1781255 RepID=A0A1E5QEK4_9CYAN|nr:MULTISPECIES: glycerophosphodiester phosphodiesterase [Desertifilum]MDA0212613.1 glycerophosphodiester phosphodiesterase [Cyanobacteria bacterium FC1]MBD2313156.1 glycerophosphodiester phosphodiesterase [Desertifilum sp. FACHB-1129]MBD2324038.1 glycerophosphodiester phosphodiesterase [Desertifilum sp. FACHB-866]MBD2333973.1 glycerophosphodiester phosphodiesterase [Desertifilum sp. FACHB-868]OEJ73067.1 glycerophosphodiester phosphodiesterase [Desertifilum tharense IPPAS B-1220]